MTVDALLSRLEGTRQTGRGRWLAKCPAHDDRRASLSIRELDDGRVLVHDFAGCAVEDVLHAAGLSFDDLFPERVTDHRIKRSRVAFITVDERTAIALLEGGNRCELVDPADLPALKATAVAELTKIMRVLGPAPVIRDSPWIAAGGRFR